MQIRTTGVLLIVVGISFLMGCAPPQTGTTDSNVQTIKQVMPHQVNALQESEPELSILDIRTPHEFAAGHLPGSINIDFYSKTFKQQLDSLNKERPYLVLCRSGNRSGQAMQIFKDLGFQNIYELKDGYASWEKQSN